MDVLFLDIDGVLLPFDEDSCDECGLAGEIVWECDACGETFCERCRDVVLCEEAHCRAQVCTSCAVDCGCKTCKESASRKLAERVAVGSCEQQEQLQAQEQAQEEQEMRQEEGGGSMASSMLEQSDEETTSTESMAEAGGMFPTSCMRSLAMIVEETECVLVLSSTWRRREEWHKQILSEFRKFSSQHDEQGALSRIQRFRFMTPIVDGEKRQDEILRWLNLEEEENIVNGVVGSLETERMALRVRSWVALDDEDLLEGEEKERRALLEEHVVRVDNKQGLTMEDAQVAISMLTKQKGGKSENELK